MSVIARRTMELSRCAAMPFQSFSWYSREIFENITVYTGTAKRLKGRIKILKAYARDATSPWGR